jgi:hypothetical protein
MWKDKDVYTTIKAFGVRVKDERQNDRNHLVEVSFETPLTHDLADQILPAMARDLFDRQQNPKPEMTQTTFAVDVKKQILTVRLAPDMPDAARILGVTLRDITAVKTEGKTWALQFKANFNLGTDAEAILFIRQLRQGVYLSMEQMQLNMLDEQQGQTDKERGTGGEVADHGQARRRRRGRNSPEGEADAQGKDAAARTDEDQGDKGDGLQPDEPVPPTH